MNKKVGYILVFLSTFHFVNAQDRQMYDSLVIEGYNLYKKKEYLKSGETYSAAFAANNGRGTIDDRYNAACAWSLAKQNDSAFVQLFRISQKGKFAEYEYLLKEKDFEPLYTDKRWTEVVDIIKTNKEKLEVNYDKPLISKLDSIYQEDQLYRMQIEEIEKKFGKESTEIKSLWKTINEKDSINLLKIVKILDEKGWLGPDVISPMGNVTLFLVIQHADLKTQEKYLPMMRDAVKKGNANPSSLALLEDRIAIRNGGKQIYGSQIGIDPVTKGYYVLPLIDPDNIDKRRAEVGLGSIQDYISNWGLKWDLEAYKKQLFDDELKQMKNK